MGNSVLRPTTEALSKNEVQLSVSRAYDESDDEVPLNSIRVRLDMMA